MKLTATLFYLGFMPGVVPFAALLKQLGLDAPKTSSAESICAGISRETGTMVVISRVCLPKTTFIRNLFKNYKDPPSCSKICKDKPYSKDDKELKSMKRAFCVDSIRIHGRSQMSVGGGAPVKITRYGCDTTKCHMMYCCCLYQ